MKVVFDSNAFISAFVVPRSKGERSFLMAQGRRFQLVTSVPILTEVAGKLRTKFGQADDDVRRVLGLISRFAEIVKPPKRLRVVADEPDNRILECVEEAGAEIVVTGDRHLLDLGSFGTSTILRLADFLRMFPEGQLEEARPKRRRAERHPKRGPSRRGRRSWRTTRFPPGRHMRKCPLPIPRLEALKLDADGERHE